MSRGIVVAICISPIKREPMREVGSILALKGQGLEGDRYATGEGSYNGGHQGKRQVTLINEEFILRTGFEFTETRRNIVTRGVELMYLIGQEFRIGNARMRGIKYCEPCSVPSKLAGKGKSFQRVFHDRGGLIAEVLETGVIEVGDAVIPPPKDY